MFQDFKKRLDRQSQAFYNLFRQADRIERLAGVIERLVNKILFLYMLCFFDYLNFNLVSHIYLQEQGDLKLRVRALESERSFQRVAAVQKTIGSVSLFLSFITSHGILLNFKSGNSSSFRHLMEIGPIRAVLIDYRLNFFTLDN